MIKVFVPRDSAARSMGADEVAAAIAAEALRLNVSLQIIRNGSRGLFWLEPLVEVETVLPDLVADDDHGLGAALLLAGGKGAAQHRALAQDIEMIRRDPGTLRLLGRSMVVADVDCAEHVGGYSRERFRLRPPVFEIEDRRAGPDPAS